MIFLLSLLTCFQAYTAVAGLEPQFLIVLDTGVGHRSTPIPRWLTSLRSLTTRGTNATVLAQFSANSNATQVSEPIGAYALAYSSSTSFLFSATGHGAVRTSVDGGDAVIILNDEEDHYGQTASMAVAEKEQKVYYGNSFTGLIEKANFDGSYDSAVRNVSQGLDYSIPSYPSAVAYAGGIAVDEERGWLYWSSVRGVDDGSIRRVPLSGLGEEQILASGIQTPGQIRVVKDSLFWTEGGRQSDSPTAIKYLDRYLSQLSTSGSLNTPIPTGTLISSSQSPLFFENDSTGEKQTLAITSFAVYRNGVEQKVRFVVSSAGRTVFGKLVEVVWRGSGSGRGPVFKVLNNDTEDVGVPVGLEYV
ncbi:hypothetical protein ACET3X_000634 [Alternaria dauci]|uniref:Uncharacterized protein n=1 Tax=Alternaria dauci TaxID=48095 RepID=A0ABR3UVI6_9PLEO